MPAAKSLVKETLSDSLGMARAFELADAEMPSALLMPLIPIKDPDLQEDFHDRTKYSLTRANKTESITPHDFTKSQYSKYNRRNNTVKNKN
jgi:hypothetical protein